MREALLVILSCTLLLTVFFYPAVFHGCLIHQEDSIGSDSFDLNIARRCLAVQSLTKYGEFPLWEPKIACGAPLFAESEAGILYPTFLFFFLHNITLAANLTVLSALLIAMLGSYWWSRCLGLKPAAACISALSYGLGETFLLRTSGLNIIHVIAWLPASLAVIHLFFAAAERRYWFLLIIIWTLQILAGHFQMAAICQICCWLYILGLSARDLKTKNYAQTYKKIGLIGAALLFAVSMSFVQIWPTYEFAKQSLRSEAMPLDKLQLTANTWEMLAIFINPFYPAFRSFPYEHIPHSRTVFYAHEWFQYIGLLPILLCFNVIGAKRRKTAVCLWMLAVFFLIASLGPRYGIYYLLWRYFPYMSSFRMPGRFAIPMACALAALAAVGLQNLHDWLMHRGKKRLAVIIPTAVIVFTGLDLGYVNSQIQGYLPASWLNPPAVLNDIKNARRVYSPYCVEAWRCCLDSTFDERVSRYVPYWQHRSLLSPGVSALWGVAAPEDYVFHGGGILLQHSYTQQMAISRIMKEAYTLDRRIMTDLAPQLCHWFRLLGVSHIITSAPLPDSWSAEEFQSIAARPIPEIPGTNIYIYALKNPLNSIRMVPELQPGPPTNILNLGKFAGLGNDTDGFYEVNPNPEAAKGIGQAQTEAATNHSLLIRTSCEQDAYLIISSTYDKNWQASVDGRPETIRRTNLSLQSLPVPQGNHRIELRYISPAFELGMKISLAALMAFLFLVALALRRKKKRTI